MDVLRLYVYSFIKIPILVSLEPTPALHRRRRVCIDTSLQYAHKRRSKRSSTACTLHSIDVLRLYVYSFAPLPTPTPTPTPTYRHPSHWHQHLHHIDALDRGVDIYDVNMIVSTPSIALQVLDSIDAPHNRSHRDSLDRIDTIVRGRRQH